MSVIRSMFHLYRFRSSGGVLWVWCWGVPGVPDTPDHRRTDSRMFRKGADRGCSLPTCPVCYACPHQTWMQWQNTTGGLHLTPSWDDKMQPIIMPLCCHQYNSCTSLRIQLFQLLVFINRDRQTIMFGNLIENCQNVCNSIFFFSTSDKEIARHL